MSRTIRRRRTYEIFNVDSGAWIRSHDVAARQCATVEGHPPRKTKRSDVDNDAAGVAERADPHLSPRSSARNSAAIILNGSINTNMTETAARCPTM